MGALNVIWERIVKETADSQIQEGDRKGLVRNFLLNDVYLRESAFAARIFATEYKRTGEDIYLNRAKDAFDAVLRKLNNCNLAEGLDEPNWTPRGIHYRKGSIPATILLLYAMEEARELIGCSFEYDMASVLEYLRLCYLGDGRFYHDRVDLAQGHKYQHVVNTTTMAYFFIMLAKSKGVENDFFNSEIKKIETAIQHSQRDDGFFPYLEPEWYQRFVWKYRKIILRRGINRYNRFFGDRSIFFGDAMHHMIVLYYYLAGKVRVHAELDVHDKAMVEKFYAFVKSHTVKKVDGAYFDFSWEPIPDHLRYCGFLSTSAYFYLFGVMHNLSIFDFLSHDTANSSIEEFATFIANELLRDAVPCINPYQADENLLQNILPRPAESVFDKGFLLSTIIQNYRT